jgi:hypothetical protein
VGNCKEEAFGLETLAALGEDMEEEDSGNILGLPDKDDGKDQ